MLSAAAQSVRSRLLELPWEEAIEEMDYMARSKEPGRCRVLLEFVQQREVWLEEQSIRALGEHGPTEYAVRAARVGLRSLRASTRNEAAETLIRGTKEDVPRLIRALESDRFWPVRASAAESLGEVRTLRGIEALRRAAVWDSEWCVRDYAIEGLCSTRDERYIPFLKRRIKGDGDYAVVPTIYRLLVEMGEERYVEDLIDLLFDSGHWFMVYLRTCNALESIFSDEEKPLPDRAIDGLKQVMRYDVGKAATWSAGDLLSKAGIRVEQTEAANTETLPH